MNFSVRAQFTHTRSRQKALRFVWIYNPLHVLFRQHTLEISTFESSTTRLVLFVRFHCHLFALSVFSTVTSIRLHKRFQRNSRPIGKTKFRYFSIWIYLHSIRYRTASSLSFFLLFSSFYVKFRAEATSCFLLSLLIKGLFLDFPRTTLQSSYTAEFKN